MGLFDSVSGLIGPAAIGAGYYVGGPLGAGLAAGGLGFMGAQSTNQANKDIATSNNEWSAAQYANRYETTVQSLKDAGLNPMLAYSQGAGSTPTAQAVQFQNPVTSGLQAFQSAGSGSQSFASATQAESYSRQADATTAKIVEETKNVSDQGLVLRMTAQELTARATLMAQQGATQQQQQAVLVQTVENLKKDGVLKDLDIDAAQSLANLGRSSKELAPAVGLLLQLLRK